MLISLNQSEIAELPSSYIIDPAPTVQPNWVSRKFESTGRIARCVMQADGTLVIKQIVESASQSGGTPLWL